MANDTTNATLAVSQVFSSPQSSHISPSLGHMPPEIKRAIVIALLERDFSNAAALSFEEEASQVGHWSMIWERPALSAVQASSRDAFHWVWRLEALSRMDRVFRQITGEWRWQSCSDPSKGALAFGSYIHSISVYMDRHSPSCSASWATLIPTLRRLEEVTMTTPDRRHEKPDLWVFDVFDAVASVAGRISGLYLSVEGEEYGHSQDSAWLASFLEPFVHLSILEIDEFGGDPTAQLALGVAIAALPRLATLRLSGDPITAEPGALTFSTAPLRLLNIEETVDAPPTSISDLASLVPWLSAYGSTLETLVFQQIKDDDFSWGDILISNTRFPPTFLLPRLSTLYLDVTDAPFILDIFSDAPLQTVVLDISHLTITTQLITNFIAAHPTLKGMRCYGTRSYHHPHVNLEAIRTFAEARGISFEVD